MQHDRKSGRDAEELLSKGTWLKFSTGGGSGKPISNADLLERFKRGQAKKLRLVRGRWVIDIGDTAWAEQQPEEESDGSK